jgi:hypothetical protein
MRGLVIQAAIDIEMLITQYIAQRYSKSKKKQDELICLILAPRVTLDGKYQIFHFLVNQYEKKWLTEHPDILKTIKSIIENRNVFAHIPVAYLEINNDALHKETVMFYKEKNSGNELTQYMFMNPDDINELLESIHAVTYKISMLLKKDRSS